MIEPLRAATLLYLDSAPLIYFIEEHERFSSLVEPVIQAVNRGDKRAFTSYVTLVEVLVKPLERKRPDLVRSYRKLLLGNPNLRMAPIERSIAEEAARLRASYRFRIPDAVQLATARLGGAEIFLTNDESLRAFRELAVVVLSDYLR